MQRTLSTQNNCFLPNFKKNHMMRRYEDQFSTYVEQHQQQQQHQPAYHPEMRNTDMNYFKHKGKHAVKPKKVELNVTHESGLVFGL